MYATRRPKAEGITEEQTCVAHSSHSYGFSPVSCSKWTVKCDFRANHCPHSSHSKGRSSLWNRWVSARGHSSHLKMLFEKVERAKTFSRTPHTYGFSPVCSGLCLLKTLEAMNCFLRTVFRQCVVAYELSKGHFERIVCHIRHIWKALHRYVDT